MNFLGKEHLTSEGQIIEHSEIGLLKGNGTLYFMDKTGTRTSVLTIISYCSDDDSVDVEVVDGVEHKAYAYRPFTVKHLGAGNFIFYFKDGGVCPRYLKDKTDKVSIDLAAIFHVIYKGRLPIFAKFANHVMQIK
jgi:hypothetical protein